MVNRKTKKILKTSKTKILSGDRKLGRKTLKKVDIVDYIVKRYLGKFPYVNKIYSLNQIYDYARIIKNAPYRLEKCQSPLKPRVFNPKNNRLLSIYLGAIDLFDITHPDISEANYIVMDYFSEFCKVKCMQSYVKKMPIETFNNMETKRKIAAKIISLASVSISNSLSKSLSTPDTKLVIDKAIEANKYLIPSAVSSVIYFCNYFRPSTVLQILNHFNPKSVLDMSAGWGDRLLGCILYGCNYTGFDPSECMSSVYNNIISSFKNFSKSNTNYIHKVHSIGFETSSQILKNEYPDGFDLILSSPPYFDLEQYEQKSGQSFVKYSGFHNWLINFMFVSLQILWRNLNAGGHMVLYIDDIVSVRKKYIWSEPTIYYCCENLPNCEYLGMIYTKSTNIRQCFVFKKLDIIDQSNQSNQSNHDDKWSSNMKKYYPEIEKLLKQQ
jgi:hypothetical protein